MRSILGQRPGTLWGGWSGLAPADRPAENDSRRRSTRHLQQTEMQGHLKGWIWLSQRTKAEKESDGIEVIPFPRPHNRPLILLFTAKKRRRPKCRRPRGVRAEAASCNYAPVTTRNSLSEGGQLLCSEEYLAEAFVRDPRRHSRCAPHHPRLGRPRGQAAARRTTASRSR